MAGEPRFERVLIVGNSGSGKSWLAARLSAVLPADAVDLDRIHWEPAGTDRARDAALAREMVRRAAAQPAWIIEGVYGWLAQEAVSRATALIWLDIPVGACVANLHARGMRRGGDGAAFEALLAWAGDYARRDTSSSLAGHGRLFAGFAGRRFRFVSRAEIDGFLASFDRHDAAGGVPAGDRA